MSTVVVAMSGGVDSSVAALLLKNKGYEVIGITFKNFDESQVTADWSPKNCCSAEYFNNAYDVCEALEIPHYVINSIEPFEKHVIDDFRTNYNQGLTPNPCVRCNSLVRWPKLIDLADEFSAEFIATGHYARIVKDKDHYYIQKSESDTKDQTYALWGINPEYLSRTLFPVGEYSKNRVRELARENELVTFDMAESQDICFVPRGKYTDLLDLGKPGEIVNTEGEVLGIHKGLQSYTIGQRRGLGISYSEPLYVLKIDLAANRLVVGTDEKVFKSHFTAKDTNWFVDFRKGSEFKCLAKVRYRHEPASCKVKVEDNNRVEVVFDEPQRAITPGQSAVFYDDRILLGGGLIERVF